VSVIIQGYQLRAVQFGAQVIKGPLTLPASTLGTIATVAGGSVMVTSMLGLVTTVIQTQACTISLGITPTGGSSAPAGIATASASISAMAVGDWLVPLVSGGVGGALVLSGGPGNAVFLSPPFIVGAGAITWTTSATNTGAIKWYFTYVPLDIGANLS
jgi:hypothetical protein